MFDPSALSEVCRVARRHSHCFTNRRHGTGEAVIRDGSIISEEFSLPEPELGLGGWNNRRRSG